MPVLSEGKIRPLSLFVLPSLVGGFYLIVQNVCLRSSRHIQIQIAERWKKGIPPPNPKDTSAKDTIAYVLSRTSLDGWLKIIVLLQERDVGANHDLWKNFVTWEMLWVQKKYIIYKILL